MPFRLHVASMQWGQLLQLSYMSFLFVFNSYEHNNTSLTSENLIWFSLNIVVGNVW